MSVPSLTSLVFREFPMIPRAGPCNSGEASGIDISTFRSVTTAPVPCKRTPNSSEGWRFTNNTVASSFTEQGIPGPQVGSDIHQRYLQ